MRWEGTEEEERTIGPVEVRRLAEGSLRLGGGVADVVTGLEATDEAHVGIDFVGLLRGAFISSTRGGRGRGNDKGGDGGRRDEADEMRGGENGEERVGQAVMTCCRGVVVRGIVNDPFVVVRRRRWWW